MVSKEMAARLNEQMNLEFCSYYSYLAMAAYCRDAALTGSAHWFSMQAEEERLHAMKIYNYINDVGATVTLLPISQPEGKFSSFLELFQKALGHEQKVTLALNKLIGSAAQENDYATHIFLQWFITEQIEEESTVKDIVERVKLVENSGEGILLIDHELGVRMQEGGGKDYSRGYKGK